MRRPLVSIYDSLFTIHLLLLQSVSAGSGHARFRSVRVDLIAHPRRLPRLRIDNLHVGNAQPRFFIDDAAAAIARRFLVALNHAGAFDFHLARDWRHRQHPPALALVAAGDHDDLIVLLDFRALPTLQLFSPPATPIHRVALLQITSGASETIFI